MYTESLKTLDFSLAPTVTLTHWRLLGALGISQAKFLSVCLIYEELFEQLTLEQGNHSILTFCGINGELNNDTQMSY